MKTEVYSWRISAQKKLELETEARREGKSLAQLLEEISSRWLEERDRNHADAEQEEIRRRVFAVAGTIRGGDASRSERSRELVRKVIRDKHEKERNASGRPD